MTFSSGNAVSGDFFWFNTPQYTVQSGEIILNTTGETNFWQRTYYGFAQDNGHALLHSVLGNFTMSVRTHFTLKKQYDQCGLMVRVDALNWIKVSLERENAHLNRLGSVVTNLGYSDWATTNIEGNIDETWYRIRCKENDFYVESSYDGKEWIQIRLAHLHNRQRPLNVGIYACSPNASGFTASFSDFQIDMNA